MKKKPSPDRPRAQDVLWSITIIVCAVAILAFFIWQSSTSSQQDERPENAMASSSSEQKDVDEAEYGEPTVATIGIRDIMDPGNSGIFNRDGRVEFVDLAEALEELGLTDVTTEGTCLIGKLPDSDNTIRFKTEWLTDEDSPDETLLLTAEIRTADSVVMVSREQRVMITKEALKKTDNEAVLLPTILWYDSQLGVMLSEREVDCLKWLLVNDVPTDVSYVEDILFEKTPLRNAPAD